jgi:hypothetical protein
MTSLRESYRGTWKKSAYQENLLKREIERRFPKIIISGGKGSFREDEVVQDAPIGAPDLYLFFNLESGVIPICEIEVTGSDKVVPNILWIGHHKVKYLLELEDPSSYGVFFFFGKSHQMRYFMRGDYLLKMIRQYDVQEKIIRGVKEFYHLIPSSYFLNEAGFWSWLLWRMDNLGIL